MAQLQTCMAEPSSARQHVPNYKRDKAVAEEYHDADFSWEQHAAESAPMVAQHELLVREIQQHKLHAGHGMSQPCMPPSHHGHAHAARTQKTQEDAAGDDNEAQARRDSGSQAGTSSTCQRHSTCMGPENGTSVYDGSRWEEFYSTVARSSKFYKERRYILLEFPVLAEAHPPKHIVELGCGYGASLLPVLKTNPAARVTGTDISSSSVQQLLQLARQQGLHEWPQAVAGVAEASPDGTAGADAGGDDAVNGSSGYVDGTGVAERHGAAGVAETSPDAGIAGVTGAGGSGDAGSAGTDDAVTQQQHHQQPHHHEQQRNHDPRGDWTAFNSTSDASTDGAQQRAPRVTAFAADSSDPQLAARLLPLAADIVLIIFTLSAVTPQQQASMLRNAYAALRPGGRLLVRDHGQYDMVQLRMLPEQWLSPGLYMRKDGTLAFFFTVEDLSTKAQAAGFEVQECSYACVYNLNRRTGQNLKRVFVHGVFIKPDSSQW